ncbi:MAG TPA: SUMF1/EgtB/PvdO family nonheme iron enzyme [Chryseolinea sp.]|nr:SUMF1/EgtB/PvdO family nonheme iron enzyme [Chryseolinea sp.]
MNSIRQNAVVMFSDVVGYTAMMGDDEAAALSRLQENHRIQKNLIEKFSGTFVKEIGDGLLAYFPTADSAVLCCYEIQKHVNTGTGLRVRIGLNQAEIIIDNNDIFGDGVNIASRIEALADPGGIYFSEHVAESLSESIRKDCVQMGKAKLKNVKTPVMIFALQGESLPLPSKRRFQSLANPKKKLAIVPALLLFVAVLSVVIFGTTRYFRAQAIQEEARNSLGEIEQLVASSWRDYSEAYEKAKGLQQIIPDDPRLKRLIKESSVKVNINTEPEDAEVFVKKYNSPGADWRSLGRTPIDSAELPIAILRWKVEKEGYKTVMAVDTDFEFKDFSNLTKLGLVAPKDFYRKLDSTDSLPMGMTRVMGSTMPYGNLEDFLVDVTEVTNKQYKQFVDAGGYTDEKYWNERFILDGKRIQWDEAMKLFTDKTGQAGPSTWMNGTYLQGREDFPVSGVSWYEASAYATYVKKDLPTGDHWGLARGENTFVIRWPQMGGFALFAPFSNFNRKGAVRVGSLDGVTAWGAYDMAGNVREWCKNDTELGKLIRGGGWNSNTYEFNRPSQAPAFDRSETNGFRCVRYADGKPMPNVVYRLTDVLGYELTPPTLVDPVPDDVFKIYKSLFDYDQTEIKSKLVTRDEKNTAWIYEKVVYKAPYNDEEIIAHMFLPRNAQPPYQTIIYGPGSASFLQTSSDELEKYYEYPIFLEYIVRSGRAVMFPVCKGTFERRSDAKGYVLHLGSDTHEYTEFMTQVIKDYRRSLDYLQSRSDIDPNNIAFYGMSWGPFIGVILSGVDARIKTNVFVAGGLRPQGRPEVNGVNFVGHITIPTLMLNGKYDSVLPLDSYIRPMYESISTPKKDKKLVLFETDHIPPQDGMVRETLAWFDKYMGKVKAPG